MVSIGEFHMAKSPHSSQRPSPNLEGPTLGTLDDPCWPPPKSFVGAWKSGNIFVWVKNPHAIAGIYGCSSRSSPQNAILIGFHTSPYDILWYRYILQVILGVPRPNQRQRICVPVNADAQTIPEGLGELLILAVFGLGRRRHLALAECSIYIYIYIYICIYANLCMCTRQSINMYDIVLYVYICYMWSCIYIYICYPPWYPPWAACMRAERALTWICWRHLPADDGSGRTWESDYWSRWLKQIGVKFT